MNNRNFAKYVMALGGIAISLAGCAEVTDISSESSSSTHTPKWGPFYPHYFLFESFSDASVFFDDAYFIGNEYLEIGNNVDFLLPNFDKKNLHFGSTEYKSNDACYFKTHIEFSLLCAAVTNSSDASSYQYESSSIMTVDARYHDWEHDLDIIIDSANHSGDIYYDSYVWNVGDAYDPDKLTYELGELSDTACSVTAYFSYDGCDAWEVTLRWNDDINDPATFAEEFAACVAENTELLRGTMTPNSSSTDSSSSL